jgi:gliding motility-associated-like protein
LKNTDDTLREQLRNKLNEYESPVPDVLWQNVASQLPQAKPGAVKFSMAKVAAVVLSGAMLTTTALLLREEKAQVAEPQPAAPIETTANEASSLPIIKNQQVNDSVLNTPTQQPVAIKTDDKSSIQLTAGNSATDAVVSTGSPTAQPAAVVHDVAPIDSEAQPVSAAIPSESPTKADARFSVIETDQSGLTFFFIPQHTSATSYSWSFGDGETSTELSPSHHYDEPGEYTVNLTMEVNGATEVFQQSVAAIPIAILEVPTIFTPNADGKNDTFDVASLSRYVTIDAVRIFNAAGTLVYSGMGNSAWGGDDMQGNALPDGNYIYKINAKDLRQQPVEKSGTVYLRR